MAEVREVKHIALMEIPPRLDGAKDGAVPFAIAARVADD
jgi:hypothetical protein